VKVGPGFVAVEDGSLENAFTFGPYINIGNVGNDYKHLPWFVHEFGHTIQSKLIGPLYMSKVALPGGISGYLDYYTNITHNHERTWFEINANQFGQLFYNPDYKGSKEWESQYSTHFSDIEWPWFWIFNPILF
jgi:hypothetical protein